MSNKNYIQEVYEVARMIPYGRVTTYGTIATFIGLGSSRMVGWALNKSFTEAEVPAHRVVNRKGELSGRAHFNPPSLMQTLLEAEGIVVKDDKIVDFDHCFWSPYEEEEK